MNISSYLKPKTNVYTGIHDQVNTQIIHYQYDEKSLDIIEGFHPTQQANHYIQVIGLSDIEIIQQIKDIYQIDPLTVEDIFNVNQRNKIEVKDDYLFGVFNISYLSKQKEIKEDYLSLLLLKDTVITFHETEPEYLEPIKTLLRDYKELKERKSDFLFFQIMDIITDEHLDVYDQLEESMINFEEEILETKQIEQDQFYLVRKQMLKLKSNVAPILEQLEKTLARKIPLFNIENQVYFDDLKDHLQRLDARINQAREAMHHLLDLHMNNQSTKMNKIMTTLTIFSAIFIPLSFLSGFFGMNFIHFGLLSYKHAVLAFTLLCLLIVSVMIIFFKKQKWF